MNNDLVSRYADRRLGFVSRRPDGRGNQCKLSDSQKLLHFPSIYVPFRGLLLSASAYGWLLTRSLVWLLSPFLKQGKKEEEEFSTGPLSVLMMSVKNNTQVGGVLLLRSHFNRVQFLLYCLSALMLCLNYTPGWCLVFSSCYLGIC